MTGLFVGGGGGDDGGGDGGGWKTAGRRGRGGRPRSAWGCGGDGGGRESNGDAGAVCESCGAPGAKMRPAMLGLAVMFLCGPCADSLDDDGDVLG